MPAGLLCVLNSKGVNRRGKELRTWICMAEIVCGVEDLFFDNSSKNKWSETMYMTILYHA